MKSYSKHKAFAFWGAAFVLFMAVFTGCPQTADGGNTSGGGKSEPKHIVSFSVDGAGGTLKAKADGVTETGTSPVTVEQDKIVTFTAVPAAGYKLKEWKVDGTVISNASNTYTHSVTTAVDVKVSFQLLPPGKIELTLSPDKLTIKVAATTADGTTVKVEGCTETELTSGRISELHARGTTVILKGNIIKLSCANYEYNKSNKLTAVNAQGCTALQHLNCSYNQLTALNVQGLSALQHLNCSDNRQLTELNVQGLTALQHLICSYTKLTALNVQGLTALQYLNCSFNRQLTALNVQGLTALQYLNCSYNNLTALNVQGLTALQELDCSDNRQLTALNVQGLTALQELDCNYNQLTELNVQGLTALQKLICSDNQLTALNVQGLSALQHLNCKSNKFTELNVQGLSALQVLYCWSNKFTELNVQGLSALQSLDCSHNKLTELNVQGLSALQRLDCTDNHLTELNVQGLTALQHLDCWSNQLTSLNVQGSSALQYLQCGYNKLSADALTKLFNDLPQRTVSQDAKCYLYTCHRHLGILEDEGNHKDFTSPGELKNAFDNAKTVKNWKMYKWDNGDVEL